MRSMSNGGAQACPDCGHTEFFVLGLVGYRQPYDATKQDYSASEIQWDVDYPEYVQCRGCKRQITEYAIEAGIIVVAYKPVERDPAEEVGAAEEP
jgi:hypothetical protein